MIIASSPRDDDGCRGKTLQPRIEINKWISKKTDLAVGGNQNFQVTARTVGFFLGLLVLKKETKREVPCACACCKCLVQARCDQNGHLENETTTQILPEKKVPRKASITVCHVFRLFFPTSRAPQTVFRQSGKRGSEQGSVLSVHCERFLSRRSFFVRIHGSSVPVQRAR